jgi:NTP pyrophosphatase (non-canonical NTP hydrolase)
VALLRLALADALKERAVNTINDLDTLKLALRDFAAVRDWKPFHTPKNLAMAMIVEAAELVEHFQWATPEESLAPPPEKLAAIRDEVADTLIYLVELADTLDIDLIAAARDKIVKNALKYPAPT